MSEYISREELIEALVTDYNYGWDNSQDTEYVEGVRDEYDDALTIINHMKGVDIQSIKHGKWVYSDIPVFFNPHGRYLCSICNYEVDYRDYNYCPNCGARMMKED